VSRQCFVLSFTPGGVEVRALYRTKAGPNSRMRARTREVSALATGHRTRAEESIQTPEREGDE
jgi:hypothetical protein